MDKFANTSHRLGGVILAVSLVGFAVYTYLLLFSRYDILVLKLTLLCFVAAIVGVMAWMGYTMVTAVSLNETDKKK